MDKETNKEEKVESQEKSEIHEENSESGDSGDKEIINEEETEDSSEEVKEEIIKEKTEDNEEVKGESAESDDSGDKEIINEEKTSVSDENINKEVVSDNNSNQSNDSEQSKEEEPVKEKKPEEKPLDKKGKEGSFMPIFFIMVISLVIAFAWDKPGFTFIPNSVNAVLNPTAGFLLNWNLTAGMLLIVLIITVLTTIIQKYATDQEALKELKKEQKILQAEMKKYKDHPEKVAELSKKQFQFIPKTFKLTSRAITFTGIPFILFFRWFNDVFTVMEATTGAPIKFLGFLSWFWFYLIFTMVFSSILRKTFKVV